MALRTWTGVGFVRRAPTVGGGAVDLRVSSLTPAHARWWHSRVQPIIDQDHARADDGWNWMLYVPFTRLTGKLLDRQPMGYAVGLDGLGSGQSAPCAMTLLLGRSPALDDHGRRSTFTWYLTTAPRRALLELPEYGLDEAHLPKALGRITLDVAVTHSLNHRGHGRVGLHADEEGGDALLDWYLDRGMTILPKDTSLPPGPRRFFSPSDGRYCYYTAEAAVAASRSLDNLR
jgi:hypothetical protein